jgi:hypothetical protein
VRDILRVHATVLSMAGSARVSGRLAASLRNAAITFHVSLAHQAIFDNDTFWPYQWSLTDNAGGPDDETKFELSAMPAPFVDQVTNMLYHFENFQPQFYSLVRH